MSDETPRDGTGEELVPTDDRVIGTAFKWSLAAFAALALVVALISLLRRAPEALPPVVERAPVQAPARLDREAAARPQVGFRDVTREAGIEFERVNGAAGEKLLPETMGGGCAFLDFDGDGDADLFLVNGAAWPHDAPPEGSAAPASALYRNDGTGRFSDVTSELGPVLRAQGMGPAVGDFDGDGDPDLFVGCLGPDHLFRNDGGKFTDISEEAGIAGDPEAWATSAGFFDHDGDGDLDLLVLHYVEWSPAIDRDMGFTLNGRDRAYGPPRQYRGMHPTLWRNEGDGRFSDATEEAGLLVRNAATGAAVGKGLALTFVDVDRDGLLDVFVANDTVQNFLFRNLGGGRFEELGTESGTAYDQAGMATGAMGVDAADFTNTGALAFGIGNFANESTSFYVQQSRPWRFDDLSAAEGVGSPSRLALSFGLFFFDYDLDGRLDLLQANGHLEDEITEIQPSQHYRQSAQLFWNRGRGPHATFATVPSAEAGDLGRPIVGRGAAYSDIDGDGDLDVILTQPAGRPLLLRNEQALGHHWLRVRLVGSSPNTEAIGAEVELVAGGVTQRRRVMPTRSYLSQVELPVTFGLGEAERVESLRVRWPDGELSEHPVPGVDRLLTVRRGG